MSNPANPFNAGKVSPGTDADTIPPPPIGDFFVAADFSNIDNRPDKDIFYTPLVAQTEQATVVFDYGPSTNSVLTDRGTNDFAQEFKLNNWGTGNSLDNAIAGQRFVNSTIVPKPGLEVELLDAGFEFWRNGATLPKTMELPPILTASTPRMHWEA